MLHRLYGSVHPYDRKKATRRETVTLLNKAPAYVVIPMAMHVGAPCKPIVAKGDYVLLGQKIGEPVGLGAPIHASISGTVAAVEERPHPNGGSCMAIVIENDYQDAPAPVLERKADPEDLTGWEIVDIIAQAGIVGLGGAGFPTSVKIKGAIGKVDTLIINGSECEPYITADHRLMLEQSDRLLGGVQILMHALGLKSAVIGVEGNKMDAIEHLRKQLPDFIINIFCHIRYSFNQKPYLNHRLIGRFFQRPSATAYNNQTSPKPKQTLSHLQPPFFFTRKCKGYTKETFSLVGPTYPSLPCFFGSLINSP